MGKAAAGHGGGGKTGLSPLDRRLLDACLRLARRNRGLTGTNPAVGTLIVRHEGNQAIVVGRGITALGGRPHAEPVALEEAGERAEGATAYVTLEPCAHHGATPPCAEALITAGIARVVTAWIDPDNRVDGRGHAMLRDAGVTVDVGDGVNSAATDLRGYLNRKTKNRPQVILKLAVSRDGKLGRSGEETRITGDLARRYVHRMRAQADGILVGRATAFVDDPDLTCRLPGLEHRSPERFVLDSTAKLSADSRLAKTAGEVPVSLITTQQQLPEALSQAGVQRFAAEASDGRIALPEVLEDMAARGLSVLMVEGGAQTAAAFLDADLVDTIALFAGDVTVGETGIASPLTAETIPGVFTASRSLMLGADRLDLYERNDDVYRNRHGYRHDPQG